jgi:hypothetical protein
MEFQIAMRRFNEILIATSMLLSACGNKETAARKEAKPEAQPAAAEAQKAPQAAAAFKKTLELHGVTFQVSCPNSGSINKLSIVPAGLEADNTPIEREIEGTVTDADVADLNVDQSPEVYVYITSAGSGSRGSLVAYSANRKKSLSEIYLPPLTDNKEASKGYMGHDEFRVVESALVQRFPLYTEGDTNARPSGKTRQLQYKLRQGEAGWQLRVDKIVEY